MMLLQITVDSRYLEVQGTLLNILRYPYLEISIRRIEEKLNLTSTLHKMNMHFDACRDILKILWKSFHNIFLPVIRFPY